MTDVALLSVLLYCPYYKRRQLYARLPVCWEMLELLPVSQSPSSVPLATRTTLFLPLLQDLPGTVRLAVFLLLSFLIHLSISVFLVFCNSSGTVHTTLPPIMHHCVRHISDIIDWLIEQGLTSHQTHYSSCQDVFLRVTWPSQQCQSTEGRRHYIHTAELLMQCTQLWL